MGKEKKIVVIIIALAAVVAMWFVFNRSLPEKSETPNLSSLPQYTKTDLPADKLLEFFPKDLIQEKDPIILENYQFQNKTGDQYTTKYISQKTFEENISAYQKYLNNKKWKIISDTDHEELKMFVSISPDNTGKLVITISKSQTLNGVVVEMSLIKTNKIATPVNPNVQQSELETEKNILLAGSITKFVKTFQTNIITTGKLPTVLEKFIDPKGNGLEAKQIVYEGGKIGYEINFILKDIKMQNVEKSFQVIALNNGFKMLSGQRAEHFGFAEYESNEYKILISYQLDADYTVKNNIKTENIR